jgi:tRNA dimethylallyltransferase
MGLARRFFCFGFPGLSFLARRSSICRQQFMTMSAQKTFSPETSESVREEKTSKSQTFPRRRVLVLAGPTGVGKSAVAMELAARLNGEIISADSVQVYKGLEIGSNKASPKERACVPHHLLDVAELSSTYSAGNFYVASRTAVEDVASRKRTPIVVGGTMMYIRWLIHGRPATPPPDPDVVARVDAQIAALNGNWEAGIALVAAQDPARASVLFKNDWYRLARALQVVETTGGIGVSGMPLEGGAPNRHKEVSWKDLDHDFRCVFLYKNRFALNRSIDARCENMILPARCGMFDGDKNIFTLQDCDSERSILVEVALLLRSRSLIACSQGGSPTRAIGYRQTIEYLLDRALVTLDAQHSNLGSAGRAEEDYGKKTANSPAVHAFRAYVEQFQKATRGYAKQQLQWFRKEPSFMWLHSDGSAAETIEDLFQKDESTYSAYIGQMKTEQDSARQSMLLQGKKMKTYVSTRIVIAEDSEAERFAVELSERMAGEIAASLRQDEIVSFLESYERDDSFN